MTPCVGMLRLGMGGSGGRHANLNVLLEGKMHLTVKKKMASVITAMALVLGMAGLPTQAGAKTYNPSFPRLMGMNIGDKNYDDPQYQKDLSRLDVVILGFYPGWKNRYTHDGYTGIRAAVKALKDRNPNLLVGQYTIMNEAYDGDRDDPATSDIRAKLNKEGWWLRNSQGNRLQWTHSFGAYDVNLTMLARADENGRHWPQWLARRDYQKYFKPVPEFDIWYFDNVFEKNRITHADWNSDGIDDVCTDPRMLKAHRLGHIAEWREASKLAPGLMFMGNVDHDLSAPEYRGRLQGAFLEGMMGKSWSIERRQGWQAMMQRYHRVMRNTAAPRIVGFNVWGNPTNFKFFRYAFASSLLDDGYFTFTDEARGFSSVPWFDEYDINLGRPLQAPQDRAWQRGVYRRVFQKGVVLVNPSWRSVTVNVGSGYRRIAGRQDPEVNNGRAAKMITLAPKDGIVLINN